LCKTILDVYGDPHPATLHDLVRSGPAVVSSEKTTIPVDCAAQDVV